MKHLVLFLSALLFATAAHAQVQDAAVCDILKNPAAFNNKIVRIKGTVAAGFDFFIVKSQDCGLNVNGIWLSYPEGTKAKSGPDAVLTLQPAQNFAGTVAAAPARTPVTLDAGKDFKKFDSLLSSTLKTSDMCLGCPRNQVEATLVGRIDAETPVLRRNADHKIIAIAGFGNLNAYPVRLVLQSVAGPVPHEVEADKNAKLTGTGPESDAGGRVAHTFSSTIAFPDHPKRAADAWGKQGEDNGVTIGFTDRNVANPALEAQASTKSPDGVIYNCSFNADRLKGDLMTRAQTHMGEHIADLRTPEETLDSPTLYQLEFRAWLTTMVAAMTTGQKSLQIAGGYTLFSTDRPRTSLNTDIEAALKAYFADQAALNP